MTAEINAFSLQVSSKHFDAHNITVPKNIVSLSIPTAYYHFYSYGTEPGTHVVVLASPTEVDDGKAVDFAKHFRTNGNDAAELPAVTHSVSQTTQRLQV